MATLRVTLIRACDLVSSDSALEGSRCDPFVVFQVGQQIQQSSCIQQQLHPEWRPHEVFEFHTDTTDVVLTLQVFDYDEFNAHDLIGSLELPVAKFTGTGTLPHREVYSLDVPDAYASQSCKSSIELEICVVISDATEGRSENGATTTLLRLWENEVYERMDPLGYRDLPTVLSLR